MLLVSWSTAFFLVSVAVVVIYLCCFCCEDDDEYSNSSTSPPLPTTTTWLLYQSSPPNPYSRGEATTTEAINYGNGTHHASPTSHYVGETGQMLSTSVHVNTATTVAFTNNVHRPRLASPPSEVFPSTGPTLPRPSIRHCIHCSSSGRLCTNSCPRVVPNSSSPNPLPHAQYGIKSETSENVQEVKAARELRAQARLAVPNSSSPNPVPHAQRGVEVEASEVRTARWLREQAGRVVPNPSSPDPTLHDRFRVEDLEVEASELRTARWLREQARRVVPNSSSPDSVPHDLVGVEIEASEMRTARELRERARRVVPNSSCPDPVAHSRHGIVVKASANAQEIKTAGELREQARRVKIPNSGRPNPAPHARDGGEVKASANAQEMKTIGEIREQTLRVNIPNSDRPNSVAHARHGVEARASANAQELKTAGELREQARRVVPNSSCPNPVPHVRFQVGVEVEASANAQEMKTARELREQARSIKPEMYAAQKLAKDAHRNGDYRAEQRHRHAAEVHETQVKILDDRAAKIIFRDNNKTLQEGMVDLHGLYVPEAIEYAKKAIESATCRRDDEICFIVGKGIHADSGRSKLRPHLQGLCDVYGLTSSLDPENAGRLIIRLR